MGSPKHKRLIAFSLETSASGAEKKALVQLSDPALGYPRNRMESKALAHGESYRGAESKNKHRVSQKRRETHYASAAGAEAMGWPAPV